MKKAPFYAIILIGLIIIACRTPGLSPAITNADLFSKPISAYQKNPAADKTIYCSDSGTKFWYEANKWTLIEKESALFKEVSDTAKKSGRKITYLLVNSNFDAFLGIQDYGIKISYPEYHNKALERIQNATPPIAELKHDVRSVNGRVLLHYSYQRNVEGNLLDFSEYILSTDNGHVCVVGNLLKTGNTNKAEVLEAMNGIVPK